MEPCGLRASGDVITLSFSTHGRSDVAMLPPHRRARDPNDARKGGSAGREELEYCPQAKQATYPRLCWQHRQEGRLRPEGAPAGPPRARQSSRGRPELLRQLKTSDRADWEELGAPDFHVLAAPPAATRRRPPRRRRARAAPRRPARRRLRWREARCRRLCVATAKARRSRAGPPAARRPRLQARPRAMPGRMPPPPPT